MPIERGFFEDKVDFDVYNGETKPMDLSPQPQPPINIKVPMIQPATNEPVYKSPEQGEGGFVAGTLVHTKNGLVPIELLKVGELVLSRPQDKGEATYKPVASTFSFEAMEVCLMEYFLYDQQETTARSLVWTGNYPFWVKGIGWTNADYLAPGADLELYDGTAACIFRVLRILKTETPDVGWTHDDHSFEGPTIDLRGGMIKVSKTFEENTTNHYALGNNGYLERWVYNIEVEGFHTYYVGEPGVWVRDDKCL